MKKLFVFLMTISFFVAGGGLAQATLSFQTEPIIGSNMINTTGDVVMITGPTPIMPGGGYYHDVDNNIVLGPTIPHYSISGDPLYGVGSPSMSYFSINPNVWDGAHWYDPNVRIYTGSGVEGLDPNHTYNYSGVFSFLGTPGNLAYDSPVNINGYKPDESFVMPSFYLYNLWLEDAGNWKYTEYWTDLDTNDTISSTPRYFTVGVPEPATMLLLGLGLVGLAGLRRKL